MKNIKIIYLWFFDMLSYFLNLIFLVDAYVLFYKNPDLKNCYKYCRLAWKWAIFRVNNKGFKIDDFYDFLDNNGIKR